MAKNYYSGLFDSHATNSCSIPVDSCSIPVDSCSIPVDSCSFVSLVPSCHWFLRVTGYINVGIGFPKPFFKCDPLIESGSKKGYDPTAVARSNGNDEIVNLGKVEGG